MSGNSGAGNGVEITVGGGVRTSSCTKEELDATLIQCGSSAGAPLLGRRRPSLKAVGRSTLDRREVLILTPRAVGMRGMILVLMEMSVDGVAGPGSEIRRHRNWSRQPSDRRRTQSRERVRRVSRSPGRRSDSPAPTGRPNSCPAISGSKPAKMISIPATDMSGNGCAEPDLAMAVKMIQVKRNAGRDGAVPSRTASSPRIQSPARIKASNENHNVNLGQVQQLLKNSYINSSLTRKLALIEACLLNLVLCF